MSGISTPSAGSDESELEMLRIAKTLYARKSVGVATAKTEITKTT